MNHVLLRHPEVALRWAGRCYGASDVPLGRTGRGRIAGLVAALRLLDIEAVVHSDLARTRIPALAIARALGISVTADPDWRERSFGSWEGQSWHAIWRATGSAMDGMIDAPESFRPGETGETTLELAARVCAAHARLPDERVLVVTHGGPIAALVGTGQGAPVRDWPALVPACGEWRLVKTR